MLLLAPFISGPEVLFGLAVTLAALLLIRMLRPPQAPPRAPAENPRGPDAAMVRGELARRRRKEKRVAAAQAKERMRSAMRALGAHGYYVFDDLVADAVGLIDHLAVGPRGVFIVVTSDVPGTVQRVPETGAILADGRPLEDEDLRDRALDLARDVGTKLFSDDDPLRLPGPVCCVICLTRARVIYDDQNGDPFGIISVWDLLDVFRSKHPRVMPPERVAGLAALAERLYHRPPYVRPDAAPYAGAPPHLHPANDEHHHDEPHLDPRQEIELDDEDR